MAIGIGRDTRLRMPGALLDRVDWRSHIEQEGDIHMTQIMEANVREAVLTQQPFEIGNELGILDRFADGIGKDQVVLLPSITGYIFLQYLPFSMGGQLSQNTLSQFDLAAACFGLRGEEDPPLPFESLHLSLDVQGTFLPVDVAPLKSQQLAFPYTRDQGQVIKSLEAVSTDGLQEDACFFLVQDRKLLPFDLGPLDRIHRIPDD